MISLMLPSLEQPGGESQLDAEARRAEAQRAEGGGRPDELVGELRAVAQRLAEPLARVGRASDREPSLGAAQHAPPTPTELDPRDLPAGVGEEQRGRRLAGARAAPV